MSAAVDKETASHNGDTVIPPEGLVHDAQQANQNEHSMTLLQALRAYPKAIAWSMLLSSTLIMEGYDLALIGNLYASPVFNQKYGVFDAATDKYVISAAWQSGLSNGARGGEIIGLIIAGWAADKYGYRWTTIGSLILLIGCIFILFFAPNIETLVVGCVLCGTSRPLLPPLSQPSL